MDSGDDTGPMPAARISRSPTHATRARTPVLSHPECPECQAIAAAQA